MKPIWAIQTNAVNKTQAQAVIDAVLACGGEVDEVGVLPMTGLIVSRYGKYTESLDIIPYGSTKLVQLAMDKKWTGVFRNNNFYSGAWKIYREDMLNNDIAILYADEMESYLRNSPSDKLFFIKPYAGYKSFTGLTASKADILGFLSSKKIGKYDLPVDEPIVVSSYKQILSETRWFVVNGKVISGSAYRVRGQAVSIPDNSDSNLAEAQRMADIWLPHQTCVMDLAETPDGTKVIEFNTFNSSGFYSHDISKVVKAVIDGYSQ